MKNLITYLKALWRRGLGSQRKKIGVTLGEATIEHPFSTYSAPFGTCWQPSGKLHSVVRCAAMLVMLFTIGSGNAWADLTIDFESAVSSYTSWTFTNILSCYNDIDAHTGDCCGNNYDGSSATSSASITTVNKIASPTAFSCYLSKESKNTTSSTWYIEVSSNGSSWTQVSSRSATNMDKGTWVLFSADLSSYSNVYVRIRYSGANAYRAIDDIVLTEGIAKTLSSIAITTQPTTRKYLVGETFNSAGAVVTAYYSNSTNATVTATWTPTSALSAGTNQTVTASYTEGGVTKTATTTIDVYSVTVQKKDDEGTTIADAGVTASASGRTLSASVGATHYVFKTWKYGTASGTSIASESSTSTSLTGTPSGAVTIIAEFYKPCTITWSVNGNTATIPATTNVTYNTTSTAPTVSTPPCGTFVGWTANSSYSNISTPPGDLFNGTTPTITGDITFYAVFADEE